ncbi:hypothetical protein AVEN_97573-1 [Araneus ventricosus]|uniref:Transposase Tc1-like domain-containing protein n=1 Tax=Araneus ventricosus TaxID=182803 RepID=A0A4Y2F724_ARAVE|nr:hypothetical protein AVEN_97573-1 [Araneus ventricosus]
MRLVSRITKIAQKAVIATNNPHKLEVEQTKVNTYYPISNYVPNLVAPCPMWSREDTASRRRGSGRPHGTIKGRPPCLTYGCGTASAAEIRDAVGTTVTQRTVTNRLLQGQLRARRPISCIPLTPNHCRLRREWCQARAHWRTEWGAVVFYDESRFCLGASDGRV